jgi:ribonuclease P protein component
LFIHIVKKVDRLTKPEQFSLVFQKGISRADRLLVIKALPNQLECSRYGISVSKRVGNAVVRNRIKRVLREILRLSPREQGWDIVLIARSPAAYCDYHSLNQSVLNLMSRAKSSVEVK